MLSIVSTVAAHLNAYFCSAIIIYQNAYAET